MPRLTRPLATAATLAALAACGHNPEFRTGLASQTYTALEALYVLLAKAELGSLRSPASFAGQADSYAEIIGGFELGQLLAEGPASSGAGRLDDLDDAIRHCVDQLRQMSDLHRTTGIAPGSPAIATVRSRCVTAARAVAADEVSSWVFTTVAGDL